MVQTLTQKIFDSHQRDEPFSNTVILDLDLVLCHEVTTPLAIVDLQWRGKDSIFDPSRIKVVVDHVAPAKDTATAVQAKILRDWVRRHGIRDFFDVGENGVCHALFPEKGFIRPGYTVIMGDSHTCTLGAFGAFAAGVGTTDLEVGILKGVCAFRRPQTIRIDVEGKMPEGVYAKDVILEVIRRLTTNGATDKVIEFHGAVVDGMTMDERMTLCNMAVEAGATSGICQPDMTTVDYLWPHISGEFPDRQAALKEYSKWRSDPGAVYAGGFSVDVSGLEPLVTFGYKPDCVKPVRQMESTRIDQVYIGSCTNGRLSDLQAAARVLKGRKLAHGVRGVVNPATREIYRQAMADGTLSVFLDAGFCIVNPSCGACLGMSCGVLAPGEVCVSSTNRNFNGRMGAGAMVHLASPATAAASGVRGFLADPREFLDRG